MDATLLKPDLDQLDVAGLVRTLGEAELLRARILRRLDPVAPTPVPQPTPTRGSALTVRQVSERLKVSQAWVRRAIQSGRLASFKIGTRNIRIPESAVARVEKGNG